MKVYEHVNGVPKLRHIGEFCEVCRLGKAHQLPSHKHFERANNVGDTIHSDIFGPFDHSFPNKFCYFPTFQDDQFRYQCVAMMRSKGDIGEAFFSIC